MSDNCSCHGTPYARVCRKNHEAQAATIRELREALEALLARVGEMPNPHLNPMRHYYNSMATWKADASAVLAKTAPEVTK